MVGCSAVEARPEVDIDPVLVPIATAGVEIGACQKLVNIIWSLVPSWHCCGRGYPLGWSTIERSAVHVQRA